jgi:hypothetical protein
MSNRATLFMAMVALVAAQMSAPQYVWADEAPAKAARKAIVQVRLDGGYGYLKNLWLDKNGTFHWLGYEPDRKLASERRGKLSEQEVKEIWESAERLLATPVKDAYAGKHAGCTLVLVFDDKTSREIRMKYDKTTENDDRPQELKTLLDKLWATRRSRTESK